MRFRKAPLFRLSLILLCYICVGAVDFASAQDTISPSPGRVGAAYSAQINTEGGLAPLTWQLASGALPPGLRISSTGKIEGTPIEAKAPR